MNIALDLILVACLGLGVFGAAFATVFSQTFSFVVSVIYLYKNRDRFEFKFDRFCFSLNGPAVSSLVRLGIPMALLIIGFPRPVFSIFTTEEQILSMAASYAPVVVIMLFSSAFRAPMNGLINGSGNPRLNLALAFIDGILGHIGLAAMLGFGFGLGLTGLWYGNALAGFIPFFVGLIYYFSGKWKTRVQSMSHSENVPAKP